MKSITRTCAFFLAVALSIIWTPAHSQDFVRQQIGTVTYNIPTLQLRLNAIAFNPLLFDSGGTAGTQNIFQVVPSTPANTTTVRAFPAAAAIVLTLPLNGGGFAPILSCGNTGSGNQTCAPAAANGKEQVYSGESTLAGNTATITFPNAFTSVTSYFCASNDVTTRANPVQMVPASSTTATITNTTGATDVIQWVCIGN